MKLINVANVLLISLANILSRGASSQNHCKDGETEKRDNTRNQTWCFVYEKGKPETYANATMFCQNKGMTISPARYLQDYEEQLFYPDITPRNVWIGIRREQTNSRWYWSDGVRADIDWSSWSPLNKYKSNYFLNWSCALLSYFNRWVIKQCGEKHDFVCEYKLCPDTWNYNPYTGRCVKYFHEFKSFEEATQFCSQQHQAIVEVIRSPRAFQYVNNTILPHQHHHPVQPLRTSSSTILAALWLGMTDDAKEDDWVWNDGATVFWSNWRLDRRREGRNCATMATGDGQSLWTARYCTFGDAPFVCAKIECNWPWTLYANDTCYVDFALWHQNAGQANERCDRFGGKLAAPKTDSQNEIVRSLFFDKNPLRKYAWLGLTGESKTDWTWNDISPAIWTNWDPNLNIDGYELGCSVISKTGTWIKTPCYHKYDGTICEKPAPWKLVDCGIIPHPEGYRWRVREMSHSVGTKSTCFMPYKRKLQFTEAYKTCSFYGGFIAMPKNNEQERYLLYTAIISWPNAPHIWVGADDIAHNRSFIWNDGTPFDGRWSEVRPYDRPFADEHCVHLKPSGNHIASCFHSFNFVCQISTLEHMRVRRSWEFWTSCRTEQWGLEEVQSPSWTLYSNTCFRRTSIETTFNKATESCQIVHAKLALPKSRYLYRALVLADHQRELWKSGLWIGLHYELGRWMWSDNTALQTNETNLFNALYGSDTCVKICDFRTVPRARWINSGCLSNHSFICQKAALQPIDDYDQYSQTPLPQCGKRLDLDTKRPIDTRKKRRSLNTGNVFAGVPTSIDKFPWFVHVLTYVDAGRVGRFRKQCGGSIIADKFILTAAHCVHGHVNGPVYKLGYIIAGEADLIRNRITSLYEIAEIAIHPGYISNVQQNDIAVLKLKRPLNLRSPYTRDVCLPLQGTEIDWDHYRNLTDISKTGRTCFVAGMGKGSMSERDPPDYWYSKGHSTLSSGNIKLVEWSHCRENGKLQGFKEESSICSKITHRKGARPCHGDSGSAVVCKEDGGVYMQYGVLSAVQVNAGGRAHSCGTHYNNMHASVKVSHYSDWINEQVLKLSSFSISSVASNVLYSLWVTMAVSCSWVIFV